MILKKLRDDTNGMLLQRALRTLKRKKEAIEFVIHSEEGITREFISTSDMQHIITHVAYTAVGSLDDMIPKTKDVVDLCWKDNILLRIKGKNDCLVDENMCNSILEMA